MKVRSKSGYSLIETLGVLAIICVIAAILFPVFSRVRENGRRASCSSNLKQLHSAIQQYVQDNDSHYPRQANWESATKPYINDLGILICPSQPAHGDHHGIISDYGFNATRFNFIANLRAKGAHDSMVVVPTQFVLLEDAGDTENGAPFQTLDFPQSCGVTLFGSGSASKGYSTVHAEGANYLFGDGHVKWLKPEIARDTECAAGAFQPGFK
jgi:prepilin-type processing-associated H-X9-DG protein/prepilin-type N-terminal cleavage/methylation domain-containing protein